MRIIIVGSGIAGITFAEKFRTLSPDAKITVLTKEQHGYYSRPMLSHGFTKENIQQSIILKPFEKLLENNICIISGVEVTSINRAAKLVTIEGVNEIESLEYDKLILATGSSALIPPPFLPSQEQFFLLNSLLDLTELLHFRQSFLEFNLNPEWAIIGGGLIGCEVASDLAVAGDSVTLYHAMDRLMERQLEIEDSAKLLQVMQTSNVEILLDQMVSGFQAKKDKIVVNVKNGDENAFDGVIVSCGFKPRIDLAVKAELTTARGIKVNQFLQTNDEHIYALGDVAELPNGKLYAFIMPIRNQAVWLATHLYGQEQAPWSPPNFKAKAKVHGFEAINPYKF